MSSVPDTNSSGTSPAREPTLGYMLMVALSGENAREANRRMIERVETRSPIQAMATRAQVAAIESGDPWAHVPAALAIRAYTNRLWVST